MDQNSVMKDKMSSYSLPRLLGGGGLSGNHKFNMKFGSIRLSKSFREKRSKSIARTDDIYARSKCPTSSDLYNMLPIPVINRCGTLHKNQFRGVKKDVMEKQASLIVHSMTVGKLFIYNLKRFKNINFSSFNFW